MQYKDTRIFIEKDIQRLMFKIWLPPISTSKSIKHDIQPLI